MPKSTPINQLRDDSNLVQDILQEIEKNSPQALNQPMMELPPMNPVTNEGHNKVNVINQPSVMASNTELEDNRIVSFIPSKLHTSIFVGIITMVLIHPSIRTTLFSFIPNKGIFLRHKDNVFIGLVGIISGILFFFGKDFLP
jgi:hypothetical protein